MSFIRGQVDVFIGFCVLICNHLVACKACEKSKDKCFPKYFSAANVNCSLYIVLPLWYLQCLCELQDGIETGERGTLGLGKIHFMVFTSVVKRLL